DYYSNLTEMQGIVNFGSIARIGIGYVTGANDFFHLRPSEAERLQIPERLLKVSIRKGEQLPSQPIDSQIVKKWIDRDEPILLLDLSNTPNLPISVRRYLESAAANEAKKSYKCRNRNPWYIVPDVTKPDAFLSYMSGKKPTLVGNIARCVCTNSVHAVRLKRRLSLNRLMKAWDHSVCSLSLEIEGHPLGGGLLKIEPGEANRVLLVLGEQASNKFDYDLLNRGIETARSWRHCA
ncbi:MAG: SAM-dependent DNA methyltransferase, partial [Pyrinomonadaceae bacterium]